MEPPLNVKSSVTSRKSFATLPSTSSRRWPPPLPAAPSKRATSFLTVKLSPSVTNDSVVQRPCSNHHSLAWNHPEFTRLPTTPSCSATLTSVRTCTPTTSCPEVPPCTPVSRQNAKGDHRSCPKHHEDQDHRPTRAQILCMDRRFHPRFSLHLPTDVDNQGRVR